MNAKKYIASMICLLMGILLVKGQTPVTPESDIKGSGVPYILFAEDAGREAFEVDSLFYLRSLPLIFPVSKIVVGANDKGLDHFINYALPLLRDTNIRNARIRVRSAASPEGPLSFNKYLSRGRRDALLRIFKENGVKPSELQIDVVDEEYELLAFNMRQAGDPDADVVSRMVATNIHQPVRLKRMLQQYNGGALWKRILTQYFPQLRASRFMIIFPENKAEDLRLFRTDTLRTEPLNITNSYVPAVDTLRMDLPPFAIRWEPMTPQELENLRVPRRHVLALRTNLLYDFFYYPDYGMAPTPTFALEFYPLRGHVTYNVRLMLADWERWSEHKFWQIQDLSFEARYYLHRRTAPRDAGIFSDAVADRYKGFFLGAYAQVNRYGIGFDERRGWEGEGFGAGLSLGYVLPICKSQRCRLEFTAAAGGYVTRYDPYIYGNPFTGEKDGLYYYDTDLYRKQFRRRQHRLTWFGPTELGIHFTWDILYRKVKKGVSFKRWEK